MIPDQNLRICDAKSIVSSPTSIYSDAIDLGVLRNIGVGTPLFLRVEITESIAQGAGGGVNLQPVWSDSSALNSSQVRGIQIQLNPSNGAAGSVYYIPIAPIAYNQAGGGKVVFPDDSKKFFGLVIGIFNANTTAGAITVDIVTEINLVENVYTGAMTVR